MTETTLGANVPGASQPEEADVDLESVSPARLRSLLWRFIGGVLLVMVVLGAIGLTFGEELERVSLGFVDAMGGWGIFAGFLVADAAPVPIPHDILSTAGLLGGLGFWAVVAWASAGSLIGSTLGFAIGRNLSHTKLYRRVMKASGREANALARRYGVIALVLGALTPVTYSVTVWAAGAVGVKWSYFFLVAWLRVPRVAGYLWLFKVSVVNAIQ